MPAKVLIILDGQDALDNHTIALVGWMHMQGCMHSTIFLECNDLPHAILEVLMLHLQA